MCAASCVIVRVCDGGAEAEMDVAEQEICSGIVTTITDFSSEFQEAIGTTGSLAFALIPGCVQSSP